MKQFFTLCCGLLAMQASAQWNNDPSLNNPISVQTNLQYAASITTDGAGGAIIVWSDWRSGEGDVYAQRINAAGQVLWDADGKAVCTATGNQSFPTIYSDAAGGAFIVWQDNRGANQDIYM
jgi:beta propeller repeat protein